MYGHVADRPTGLGYFFRLQAPINLSSPSLRFSTFSSPSDRPDEHSAGHSQMPQNEACMVVRTPLKDGGDGLVVMDGAGTGAEVVEDIVVLD